MIEKRKYTCKQMKIFGIIGAIILFLVNKLIIQPDTVVLVGTTIIAVMIVSIVVYFDCKKEKEERD